MKRIAAVALGTALVLGLGACSSGGSTSGSSAESTGELRLGNMLDVSSWDPADYAGGFDAPYYSAVYDPLVVLDADGTEQPALAKSWEWSDDAKTLTLTLQDGVTFSDGSAVDAAAVVANLEHLKNGTSTGGFYTKVSSVAAAGDDSVTIELSEPDTSLLYHMGLGYSYIASPAAIDAGTLATTPVGSGPYTLDAATSQAGAKYEFAAVSDYWNRDTFPYDSVEIQVLTDATARYNALASGQVDSIFGAAASAAQAESSGFTIASVGTAWTGIMFIDRAGTIVPALGDERVRQAINYAFDGASILKEIGQGRGTATDQVFIEQTGAHVADLDDRYAYDVDKAKALMAEAGYADGFDMTMPVSPVFQAYQAIADQSLKAIGINVTWDSMSQPDYQQKLGNYGMILCVYALDSNAYANVQSQAGPGWINPENSAENDSVLGPELAAIAAASGEDQLAKITDLNEQLIERAWFAPWYVAENLYFSKDVTVTPIIGLMMPPLQAFQPAA